MDRWRWSIAGAPRRWWSATAFLEVVDELLLRPVVLGGVELAEAFPLVLVVATHGLEEGVRVHRFFQRDDDPDLGDRHSLLQEVGQRLVVGPVEVVGVDEQDVPREF
eukprot:6594862-Alexandrium_andersonii.AAC.1